VLGIISIVACLTKGTQILRFTVFGFMVEVRNSEHHLHRLASLLVHEVGVIFLTAELAAIMSTLKNRGSYLFPILGVSVFVFWFNRHIICEI